MCLHPDFNTHMFRLCPFGGGGGGGGKKAITSPPSKTKGVHMPILICLCYLKVSFLKDRVMAEQVAKDSVEAMLQGDVDNIRAELGMKAVYNLKEINLLYM